MRKIFLEGSQPTISSLSQELYLSRTSISHLLRDIKELLTSYGLVLQVDRNGIRVEGEERAVRHFIKNYFFSDSFKQTLFSLIQEEFIDGDHFSDIIMIVLEECRQSNLNVSDLTLHNLIIHLSLMVLRIRIGKEIFLPPSISVQKDHEEYQVASRIFKRLSERLDLIFPDKEVDYIAIHLNSAVSIGSVTSTSYSQLANHIKCSLKRLRVIVGAPLDEDSRLLESLLVHFKPFLHRLKLGMQLVNPLKTELLKKYPQAVEMVKNAFSNMYELRSFEITEDEYSYIALHVLASLETIENQVSYRVLVVCTSGYGSARMLESRLHKEFSAELTIVDIVGYRELTEKKLSGIDFIISAVDLNGLVLLIPVVEVSVLLTSEDIEHIRLHINRVKWFKKDTICSVNEYKSDKDAQQVLESLFKQDNLLYFDKQMNKQDVLIKMIKCLKEGYNSQFVAEFLKQITIRENIGTTVYGNVLAFPHSVKPLTKSEQVVVAICSQPIKWDDDHEEVEFIFLLSPSSGRNEGMKQLTPALVKFVDYPNLQEQLKNNPTLDELKRLLIPLM